MQNGLPKISSLEGKVVVITGAAKGIGAAVAEHVANAGAANVVITDVLHEEGKKRAQELNNNYSTNVFYLPLDVTDEHSWCETLGIVADLTGGLDVLVNNAGIELAELIENYTYQDYKKQIRVNADGVFLGCREAVRVMRPGGTVGKGGSIINLSSIAGFIGLPGFSVYGATKGFVRILTKHLAVECGKLNYGIRVNSVHPGLIETDMGDQVFSHFVDMGFAQNKDQAAEAVKAATPIGKLGKVEDIGAAVAFLASDSASYINGAELAIDGGWAAA